MVTFLLQIIDDMVLFIINNFPGRIGYKLRYSFWKPKLRFLGKNVKIDTGCYFQNPSYIVINDNCWIDKSVIILAGLDTSQREKVRIKNIDYLGEEGLVYIGKNVHIGIRCIISGISSGVYISDDCGCSANCSIYAFTHHYKSKQDPANANIHFGPMVSPDRQCIIEGAVFIGVNTGIALNSVILPGTSIRENSFVEINSVVFAKNFPSNSIISGNPAKKIKERF